MVGRNTGKKETIEIENNQETKDKKASISSQISVITLNVNVELTNQRQSGWNDFKKKTQLYAAARRLISKDKCMLKVKI